MWWDYLEVWKKINENYSVSNQGNIKSKNKILKPYKNKKGYLRIGIYKNGKRTIFSIHKLVALFFCEMVGYRPYINHIDLDKTNNHYSNLEYCTAKENTRHYIDNR